MAEKPRTFGLPKSLFVPIAARSVESIELYVGKIAAQIAARSGRVNALAVIPHAWPPQKEPNVRLWSHENAGEYEKHLHPPKQVWMHVDFANYRKAYIRFGMPEIPEGHVLDHIQNREAIRLRGYSHPYLRLCPVSRKVNTSGGVNTGGEGMEKEYIRSMDEYSDSTKEAFRKALQQEIVYADPMDLTKMLDIPPGTQVLGGVGEILKLFYAD